MKTLPVLLLCVLCVLSNIPGILAQLTICVDPHIGNDTTCTKENSCTGNPCLTLRQSAFIADHEGTTVKVLDSGSFEEESVQIVAKAIQWVAHEGGNHFTGGFHWSGDCTGYSAVKGFTIQFNGKDSPIDMGLATFTTLDLDIQIDITTPLDNGTVGTIAMVDLENCNKTGGAPNTWNLNFTSAYATPNNMEIIVFSTQGPSSPVGQNDFVINAFLDPLTAVSCNFEGYNGQAVFKSSATPVRPNGKNFLNIGSSNGFSLGLEALWGDLELNLIQVSHVDVTVLQGIDTFFATQSTNITLLDTTQPTFQTFHLANVNGFKAGNIQDTAILLDGDFNSTTLGLKNIRFTNLNGCTVTVDKSPNTVPTVGNFDIYISNSTFVGGPNDKVIENPYDIAIVAQRNWWGYANGPATNCTGGSGPSLDQHNIDYSQWCLDASCSKFSDSKCGTPNVPIPSPTPTPTPTPEPHEGPSPGAVAGIVLGVLAVIIVIAVGVWYFKFRRADYSSLG